MKKVTNLTKKTLTWGDVTIKPGKSVNVEDESLADNMASNWEGLVVVEKVEAKKQEKRAGKVTKKSTNKDEGN